MDAVFYGVFDDSSYETRLDMLDVPVHRRSIGGMAVAMGSLNTDYEGDRKNYVYRGIGIDTLTPTFPETPVVKSKPEPVALTAEEYRARERVREVARIKYRAKQARRKAQREQVEAERKQRKYSTITTVRTLLDPPDPRVDRLVHVEVGEDDPPPRPVKYGKPKPRPSRGWAPTKGQDIDAMLEEFGV